MSVLPVGMGSSGVDTGDIGHSLRCRSAASAYLSKAYIAGTSPADSSVYKKFISIKVKRSKLGVLQHVFTNSTSANDRWQINFDANDKLQLTSVDTSVLQLSLTTSAVFRDTTSWVFIDIATDATQGTASNRITVWANGVVQTLSGTFPRLNNATDAFFLTPGGGTWNARIGNEYANGAGVNQFDGYVSRFCVVDNPSGLAASSFGYQNTEINEWVSKSQSAVKAVVDAGGTNSFMLDFDDATSLTTLGYDKSSKGNNWTLNNFSLTAGVNYDHMLDVPGNSFAVLNPLDTASATLTDANIAITTPSVGYGGTRCTMATPSSGKWYWEVMPSSVTGAFVVGVSSVSESRPVVPGETATSYGYQSDGAKRTSASPVAYGAAYAANDIIGVALDLGAGTLTFYKNNVSQGTAFSSISGSFLPMVSDLNNAAVSGGYVFFGQAPLHASATYDSASGGYFRYTPPTGFKALCQRNMPDPAILNPSYSVAHRFEAGSGIASAIATDRSGWSDWMELFKRTDTTESWKVRFSDDSSNMMAFDTNGAKAAWSAPSTGTYLGAAFKLGASSGCVSGTYSGDSTSNKNISHSLGKAPTAALVKNESTGSWYVWHTKMTSAAYFTTLNSATPPAQSNTNTPWGTGNWSSTQFMVTNNATNNLNATGSTYRYVLFADIDGLLALLGHTGNASTDGVFEYAGHKAQLLIEKDLSATTGFYVWSDKIDTYNVTASYLLLNTNAGTAAATSVDICSNAVKYRSATIANAANPHMGISYSRTPGKYSLGR